MTPKGPDVPCKTIFANIVSTFVVSVFGNAPAEGGQGDAEPRGNRSKASWTGAVSMSTA